MLTIKMPKMLAVLAVCLVAGAAQAGEKASSNGAYTHGMIVAQSAVAVGGQDHKQVIQEYYDGVKKMFRQSAKMLGSAKKTDQRMRLINLQNHCSRSLGRLREILNEYETATPDRHMTLEMWAKEPYDKCRAKFEAFRAG